MATATSHLRGDLPPLCHQPRAGAIHRLGADASVGPAGPRWGRLQLADSWEVTWSVGCLFLWGQSQAWLRVALGWPTRATSVPKCRRTKLTEGTVLGTECRECSVGQIKEQAWPSSLPDAGLASHTGQGPGMSTLFLSPSHLCSFSLQRSYAGLDSQSSGPLRLAVSSLFQITYSTPSITPELKKKRNL